MLEGCWQSEGYGWLLDLRPRDYTLHQSGGPVCIAVERGSREDFLSCYDRVEVGEDRLSLHQTGDITRYRYRRLDRFPDAPVLAESGTLMDPELNFEMLWRIFDDHYAFFDLYAVDWRATYTRLRPCVGASTTLTELQDIFARMLAPLRDGHVSLAMVDRVVQFLGAIEKRQALRRAVGMPTFRVSPRSTVDSVSSRLAELLLTPFAATRSALRSACNGVVSWCTLKRGIGYLNVLRLFGLADSPEARVADDLPRDKRELAVFLRQDLLALNAALDTAIAELCQCHAMVLDLRINGGGFDCAGIAIASRFADRPRLAFTKQAGDCDRAAPQPIHVEPAATPRFAGPVAVMTSPLCVSAGEVMTLCLRALPNVITVGEHTAGMLSDNLIKWLPNGWEVSLSNETYSAHDGGIFEGSGIPPQMPLEVLGVHDPVGTLQASLVTTVQHLEARIGLTA